MWQSLKDFNPFHSDHVLDRALNHIFHWIACIWNFHRLYFYFSMVWISIFPLFYLYFSSNVFVFFSGLYLYFSIARICISPLLAFVFAQVERGSQVLRRCRSRQQSPGWSRNCAAIILDPMMILFCICICNEIQNSKTATNGLGITLSLFLIQWFFLLNEDPDLFTIAANLPRWPRNCAWYRLVG